MKALVYHGPGNIVMTEVDKPQPGPGEVCVKVRAVSICGSDLKAYRGKSNFRVPPLVMGHEFAGEIDEVSLGVVGFRVGQRVTVNPNLNCGNCHDCKKGATNLCSYRRNVGTTMAAGPYNGAMAEYVCVPAAAVIPLPEELSFEEAALLEPLAVSLHAVKYYLAIKGARVAVIGAGPIGLLAVQCAKGLGAELVILGAKGAMAPDSTAERQRKAADFGADLIINTMKDDLAEVRDLTNGIGLDVVFDAVGTSESIKQSIQIVKNGGEVILIGLAAATAEFSVSELVPREIRLCGSYIYTAGEMREAIRMVADGRVNLQKLITTVTPLEKGPEMFAVLAARASEDIKIVLTL